MAVKREAENDRIVLPGQSKGVKKHNRRAKALLAQTGGGWRTSGGSPAPIPLPVGRT